MSSAESSDSNASIRSNTSCGSIEQPPSVGDGLDNNSPITNQFNKNIQLFLTLYNSDVSDLQEQINKLFKIADDVEDIYRRTTIGSLSGGVIGASGGITAVVGLALMPFTLGTSLIVSGVGVGVSFLGGLTGAASNITRMIHQKINRGKIDEIIKTFKDKVNIIIKVLEEIQNNIEEIKALNAQFTAADFSQAGIIGAKSLTGIAEFVKLGLVTSIGRVAAHLSKTVKVAGSITVHSTDEFTYNSATMASPRPRHRRGSMELPTNMLSDVFHLNEELNRLHKDISLECNKHRETIHDLISRGPQVEQVRLQKHSEMGNTQSTIKYPGYTLVSEDKQKILVKNEGGDHFVIKKFNTGQENDLNLLLQLNHPHILHYKEVIPGPDCLYLVLEHCEGGDLAQKIKHKILAADTFSENEILDWTVMICMALKYLHDKNVLHTNLQPKSLFFTTSGIIRLGEFGEINERSTDAQTTDAEGLAYVAPENLTGEPYDEKTEIWRLGCVIYELCKLKCAFMARNPVQVVSRILTCSYEALPNTFSEDLRQLVKDTLQKVPANRPSISNILSRPFIIGHLHKMSIQTTDELYKTLDVLRNLAEGLETVHFNTTVSSLTGGVVGLAGGITSVVGLILAPFTLGASLIVTGVGIGTAVAGGITAGASNITNMVNQQTNRQKIKMIITEFQEKITSIICCIQNISEAVETLENEFSTSSLPGSLSGMSAGVRLGRGLGGIPELIRLTQVVNIGKIAAQAARAVRVVETVTGVLSALFIAVDIFFVFLDSKEIHNLRSDYALKSSQESTSNQSAGSTDEMSNNSDKTNLLSSNTQQAEQLKSETMKFVSKIKETTEELRMILDTLRDALNPNSEMPNTDN
ncbi:hypothetical protein Q8A67_001646 [Cirrhinus molitorella]|uniref:Protein kinase domain-containing protein n=1 Tax=Cirrhinus molitorella TaxID=172907 RepID=A0AA88Q9K2_9TELE|nr:hypothetical protein Q8A67_001646 [Cirrhinus molitorella]